MISCKEKEKQLLKTKSDEYKTEKTTIKPESKKIALETKHCFVKEVTKKGEKYFIIADYIDFLTNEKAVEKAKEQGEAEYDISEKGDTIYFVYNDYYISNVNPKLRTLELSSDVKIELWNYPKNNGLFSKVSITEFIDHLKAEPILILTIENGVVTEMKEQYTP